jgi:hypothetical protein
MMKNFLFLVVAVCMTACVSGDKEVNKTTPTDSVKIDSSHAAGTDC